LVIESGVAVVIVVDNQGAEFRVSYEYRAGGSDKGIDTGVPALPPEASIDPLKPEVEAMTATRPPELLRRANNRIAAVGMDGPAPVRATGLM